MSKLQLEFYQEKYKNQLEAFELEQEQERFTAYPQEIMETLVDQERHFILIIQEEKVVGYFVLHEKNGPVQIGFQETALLIRALAIDKREQKKGYAIGAMKLLPDFVRDHFKGMKELVLIVNHANLAAHSLYIKAGFTDSGLRRNGAHGLQFLYQFQL